MPTETKRRKWLVNLSRFIVVLLGGIAAVFLAEKLDKFFGLLGALLCAPLAFMMPACLHLKLLAKNRTQRMVDYILILISLAVLVFCVTLSLLAW